MTRITQKKRNARQGRLNDEKMEGDWEIRGSYVTLGALKFIFNLMRLDQ
jgi:hypothetical protein